MYILFHYCLIAALTVALSATAASAATKITLRDRVEMTTNLVRLGDVADIAADNAEEAGLLASLPLMPVPAAGAQRFARQREIADTLTASGFDMRAVEIGGAAQVTIVGARIVAPRPELAGTRGADTKIDRRAVLQAGRVETSPSKVSNSTVDSKIDPAVDADSEAILNDGVCSLISCYLNGKSRETNGCTVTCEVPARHLAMLANATTRPVCRGGLAPWTGRQRFEISFATAAGISKFSVYANVTPAPSPVVVATRAMGRGEVVTAADIELQSITYSPKATDRRVVARSVDDLIGMEVRHPIPAGAVVYADAVEPPLIVKRGELIRISSRSGGIRVQTTARALQDRSQGQLVEVESLTTKERFDARVTGPGEAVVAAVTRSAVGERPAPIETAGR